MGVSLLGVRLLPASPPDGFGRRYTARRPDRS
jgi:hypothetical protein